MLKKLSFLLKNVQYRYQNRNKHRYMGNRHVLGYAPYRLHFYSDLLKFVKQSEEISFVPFSSGMKERTDTVRIYVRHDIDTRECMNQLPSFHHVDQGFGVQSGFYFRADDVEYCLREHREMLGTLRQARFEVGLHTLCYLQDDYLQKFKDETDKFITALGFPPKSFTVHGLGIHRREVRLRFTEEIAEYLPDFGYDFSDCHSRLRTYDYVIEDCHWDEKVGRRFIYNDFIKPPPFLRKGANCLILTHPCYWRV